MTDVRNGRRIHPAVWRAVAMRRANNAGRGARTGGATFVVSGVTRDSTGAPIANCQVEVFRTSDDLNLGGTISDGSGNFSFTLSSNSDTYFIWAQDPGNTLAGGTLEGIAATPVGT